MTHASLTLYAAVGTASTGKIHRRTVLAAPDLTLVALPPSAEVAVWVAAHRRAEPFRKDQPATLVQPEPIRTAAARAANAVQAQLVPVARPD
jgi:hypothetical protein